jgi:hypothetical protein
MTWPSDSKDAARPEVPAVNALLSAGLSPAGGIPWISQPNAEPFIGQPGVWVDEKQDVGAEVRPNGEVVVGWLDLTWPHPHQPAWYLRQPTAVDDREQEISAATDKALQLARRRRTKALRRCHFCGERCLPGHMDSTRTCQSCAERHRGVVH